MPNDVLLISGFDRSGKSTASEILKKNGFFVFECGAVVKELISSTEKIEISAFYEKNMEEHNLVILEKILEITKSHESLAIIGVRSIELYRLLIDKFPHLKLVFIESEDHIRYQRYTKINGTHKLQFNLFLTNDTMQIKWGLEEIKKLADFIISNNGDYLEFVNGIERTVQKL